MDLPVPFPVKPMLAKASKSGLPAGDDWVFEPKWDGYRCVVFRDGDEVELGSRNARPLTRYFPEMLDPVRAALPDRAVVDGELLVVTDGRLDFDGLGQRIHPAQSRVEMLAEATPAIFVAFDLLAVGDESLMEEGFSRRRAALEAGLRIGEQVRLTPTTTDRDLAADWFTRFEGAGLDGLIAKDPAGPYLPDKRSMIKVKHQRTADCVVAGYRTHKDGQGVGSMLLGIDGPDGLRHVGVCSSFSARRRSELVEELAPYEGVELADHPWGRWAELDESGDATTVPGGQSRWSGQRDLTWTPLRPELVVEVKYSIMTNGRFRGVTSFVRWRPDKDPADCSYDQLDEIDPMTFEEVIAGR